MTRAWIIFVTIMSTTGCSTLRTPSTQPSGNDPATASASVRVTYDPATFRAETTRLISARQYRAAIALVKAADVDRQLVADGGGYIAVVSYTIRLPGVDPQIQFDPSRDWEMPGTSDAIEGDEHAEWQAAAIDFAERYNRRRRGR